MKLDPHEAHKLLKEHIVLALSLEGWFVWSNETGAIHSDKGYFIRYGLSGSSDVLGTTPTGRFAAIEAKTRTGQQQRNQKAFQLAVEKRGGLYHVAKWDPDTETIETARKRLIVEVRDKLRQIQGCTKCSTIQS